jgi:type IV pilus assembly protein PilC
MNNMKNSDQIFFFKRLTFLTKAGLGLIDSLSTIQKQSTKKHSTIINHLITDISNGKKLSKSLARFPKVFNEFSINIIDYGESSGTLSENLEYLTEEITKKNLIRKKLINSLIYPIVIGLSTLCITIFLIVYLFPKITPVFKTMNIELPTSTKILIYTSNFVINNWLILLLLTILIILGLLYILKNNKRVKYFTFYKTLSTPVIGDVIKKYMLSNITRTLGVLLQSGMSLSEAILVTERTTQNIIYKKELKELLSVSERGEQISFYTQKNNFLFPHEVTALISSGEKSGNLSESLIYVSKNYEQEIEEFTKNISILIEPIMMIIVGVVIGFVSISIISPIYSITQHIQK